MWYHQPYRTRKKDERGIFAPPKMLKNTTKHFHPKTTNMHNLSKQKGFDMI